MSAPGPEQLEPMAADTPERDRLSPPDASGQFAVRCEIAELMMLGGVGIRRRLAQMDEQAVEDIAVEALAVFAILGDGLPAGANAAFWRRYARTGTPPVGGWPELTGRPAVEATGEETS